MDVAQDLVQGRGDFPSCLHDIECHVGINVEIRFPRLDIRGMR
jgi:hypothetical protein